MDLQDVLQAFNEDESVYQALMGRVEHIDLKVELVIIADNVRSWQVDLQGVLERSSRFRSEIVVDGR